jgi:nucleoid-associated protein YgaU
VGLVAFIKEAGEKLFGKEVKAAEATGDRAAANAAAGDAILAYVQAQRLAATGLTVTFEGSSGIAKVYGVADDQATREKIILAAGNVDGVAGVEDNMTVSRSGPPAQYYTVVRGDTLSKIAKQFYGDANKYPAIFEANKPMLTHPDKIYPGQNLRIPPL